MLLHACCHNPTGFDLGRHDWQRVLEIVKARRLLPLLDFAYQGFGDGLEEDAWAVRLFAETLPEMLITSSCSKNFGLYRERTGASRAEARASPASARAHRALDPKHDVFDSSEAPRKKRLCVKKRESRVASTRFFRCHVFLGDSFGCTGPQKL